MNDAPTPATARKFGSSLLGYIRKFHESVSQKMANRHMRIFDAAIMVRINHDGVIGDFSETPAFRSNQRDGLNFVFVGPFERFDKVRRIAADAHGKNDVAGAREVS